MGKRAQRIPSWPGVINSNKGRIHLRRPTCHAHFLLATKRRTIHSGLPVIRSEIENAQRNLTITLSHERHSGGTVAFAV